VGWFDGVAIIYDGTLMMVPSPSITISVPSNHQTITDTTKPLKINEFKV